MKCAGLKLIIMVSCFVTGSEGQIVTTKLLNLKHQQKKVDSLEEAFDKKSQFQFHGAYTNKVIFAGRNFGVRQSGVNFGTTYHHRSGLNLEYEGNYWNGMENPYALTEVGAYYEKSLSRNFYVTGGYWRLFYHNGDEDERKLFTNFFLLDESWYTSLGQLNASYFFIKGTQTGHRLDFNFSKGIHLYNFLAADKFTIEPTLTVTWATANYISFLSSFTEEGIEDQSTFHVANYEFSLPFTYKRLGKFELNAAWHQAWPVAIPGELRPGPVSYFTFEVVRMLLSKKSPK